MRIGIYVLCYYNVMSDSMVIKYSYCDVLSYISITFGTERQDWGISPILTPTVSIKGLSCLMLYAALLYIINIFCYINRQWSVRMRCR